MTHSLPLGPTSLAIRLGDADQERARAAWLERAGSERWAERLFDRDTSLWTTDERVAASISERLGWLDAPAHFTDQIPALEGFGEGVRDAGFTAWSSPGWAAAASPRTCSGRRSARRPTGSSCGSSTRPTRRAVARTVDDLDPLATLFIVATKSGTTTEPLAFLADAWDRVGTALREHHAPRSETPGELMAVITDPGRSLGAIPHHDEFR